MVYVSVKSFIVPFNKQKMLKLYQKEVVSLGWWQNLEEQSRYWHLLVVENIFIIYQFLVVFKDLKIKYIKNIPRLKKPRN